MREFVVSLEYERGVDPVMDVFVEHPQLVSNAVTVSVGAGGLTRVDRLSGPAEALDALESVFLDESVCNECTAPDDRCDADRTYELLDAGKTNRTVYTHHSGVSYCNSVPYHAASQLPPGLLFDSRRREGRHEWRVLIRDAAAVGDLYDVLETAFPDGVTISFRRLSSPERWGEDTGTLADLSPEQRRAIERAVELDYYETPRGATLEDLSEDLDVPKSTIRYRLRRAEDWLTNAYVERDRGSEPSSSSAG